MLRSFLADSERALSVMVTGATGLLVAGFIVAVTAILVWK
jgi:hypothetical protein